MNVRLIAGLGIALALSAPMAAHAQNSVSFGVSGGIALPIGDLGDAANLGFDLGARLQGQLASNWALRGDLNWDRFGGKGIVDNYSYLSVAGNFVHREPADHLYEFFGPGVYSSKVTLNNGANDSRTDLGLQGGIGLNMTSGDLKTFLEFGITSVFTSGSNAYYFPVRFGIRF